MTARRAQAGAALIAAMLIVALVAAIATAALWHQAGAANSEAAERGRLKAAWVLNGALEWSAARLREDGRGEPLDHLGEGWALAAEADLSSFLGGQGDAPATDGAVLAIRIDDAQARLNLFNLAEAGAVAPADRRVFQRLFEAAALPAHQLDRLADNLREATSMEPENLHEVRAALPPQRLAQLAWLGLPAQTIAVLQRHVNLLPARSLVNLNTASAQVIQVAAEGLSLQEAMRLVEQRRQAPFRTLADAGNAVGRPDAFAPSRFSVSTRFFEVTASLRTAGMTVTEKSLLMRNGTDVVVLRRERGAPDAPGPAELQAPMGSTR